MVIQHIAIKETFVVLCGRRSICVSFICPLWKSGKQSKKPWKCKSRLPSTVWISDVLGVVGSAKGRYLSRRQTD